MKREAPQFIEGRRSQEIMDKDLDIEFMTKCTVKFKGVNFKIWICNYPYASFSIHGVNILPSRCMMLKFAEFLKRKIIEYSLKETREED
jgi:hypothetical protein